MAATIRTASRTTASLSDAKNLKTEPRCQGGRAEEIVAMVGRAVSTRKACDSTLSSSSPRSGGRRIEGSRRRYLKAFAAGSLDSARDDGKISPISFAVPLLFSPAPGQGRGSADFFAPSPAGVETQIHFPRRSCFLPRAYSAALHQPSACPGLPAFANRFRIT